MFIPQYDLNGKDISYTGNVEDLYNLVKSRDGKFRTPGLTLEKFNKVIEGLIQYVAENLIDNEKLSIEGIGDFTIRPEDRPKHGEEIDLNKIIITIPKQSIEMNSELFKIKCD